MFHCLHAEREQVKYLKKQPEIGESLQREARERVAKLQLTSDILLSVVLGDVRSCEEVVGILTGRDIRIQEVKTQYSIRQLETRSVILDIYGAEEDGTRFTLEMHLRADEDHFRRNRYNIASIDMSVLDKGVDHEHLPDVHAIYMSNQKFGKTNHAIKKIVRSYDNVEDAIASSNVENGIHEYYVNLKGDAATKEQEDLLKYLMDTDTFKEHEAFPNLIRRVRYHKEKKEGVEIMCEVMGDLLERSRELGVEQGMEQGIEQGIEQERTNMIQRMVKEKIPKEAILTVVGISEAEYALYVS